MSKTFPVKDADFMSFALNVDGQCTAHENDWGLSPSMVTKLHTLTTAANNAFEKNNNPETKNRRTAASKQVHFGELKPCLSIMIKMLEVNDAVTEEDLRAMGLPSREHHYHEPLPVPTEATETSIAVGQHHDVTVYVSTPQHGQPTEFLQSNNYYGFVVRYRKEEQTEWHEEHSTRLHLTHYFEDEDKGKHLKIVTAWINPRIQHGPWSDEIEVLIN
ncbi:MAG: hypothetical protein LBD52_06480 [Prevotellaceae bacterium]|jgi:hypothetical protein|nr:hypothetical protein [Prevotellaceae bacterium]